MQVTEEQAIDLLYYGKTRDGWLDTNTGNSRLDLAFDLFFDYLSRNTALDAEKVKAAFAERLTAIANLKPVKLQSKSTWRYITGAGQVQVGDKLRFKIGDREHRETVKQILHPGAEKEEVIYHMRENFYFITSMVISGFSNHKCVEVLTKIAKAKN